jgi:hypothetical protein
MSKLHELLAAEKTPTGAWNQLYEDTLKKFKNQTHFFEGHSKYLSMIEETPGNKAVEDQAREEKPVATTVFDTLDYALKIFSKAEDFQFQKNKTNQIATGDIYWKGNVVIPKVPVDELLGLEARLTKLRQLFQEMPTLDATKYWDRNPNIGENIWETKHPDETTKTEKQVIPIVLKDATKEHPAQVQAVQKDVVIGKFTTVRRSGAATALQKAEMIKTIDELLIEIKQARMRANETEVVKDKIGDILVNIILNPLKT